MPSLSLHISRILADVLPFHGARRHDATFSERDDSWRRHLLILMLSGRCRRRYLSADYLQRRRR